MKINKEKLFWGALSLANFVGAMKILHESIYSKDIQKYHSYMLFFVILCGLMFMFGMGFQYFITLKSEEKKI